ncbi:hypothetical protein MTR67_048343 [Solanum verrucosum]|uniref:Uncharacterized protein n=1 Tax=Solanum verrucosum TaxID=315347 RepID=A0AAF0V1A5_SOLVR|nr:hypothetical protein MTR67_048343 [Solanum verrucosum]
MQMRHLRAILTIFEGISGLHVNWHKSCLYPINQVTNMQILAVNVGCQMDSLPTKYLGMPLVAKNKEVEAVEFSKLVSSLRTDESEDVIVSACQKLIAFFHQRPDQKLVFVTQHGLLPLMELLEVPKTRVMCSVLQVLNLIVQDNTDSQENACLVGLIPVVMSFAAPDRPREIRMEAAYFFQQLCQSSPLTLQMFIANRGIPVLVGFLEADYAKYRFVFCTF